MGGVGIERRMQILREAADQHVLKPLRTHGWEAEVASTNEDGEYLIVTAQKSTAQHKIALLYSSATDSKHYKNLDTVVEHIFTNGALYHIESYACGIAAPVTPIDEFFPLLLDWNRQLVPVAPVKKPFVRKADSPIRHITAENPLESIWAQLDQFASFQLAERLIMRRAQEEGVTLRPEVVRSKASGLAYSVRNASDYLRTVPFESLNKRILSLYYGVLALASSEMLASPIGPSDLDEVEGMTKLGHGLYTVSSVSADFGAINVGVLATGFFPRWLSFLGHDTSKFPKAKPKTASDVDKVPKGMVTTIRSLLSAIPELEILFLDVFDTAPSWVVPVYAVEENPRLTVRRGSDDERRAADSTYIHLIDPSGRIDIAAIQQAEWPIAEISDITEHGKERTFRARVDHAGHEYWHGVLPSRRSPFESRASLIIPVLAGTSEYRAVALSLLYALSILVRYMPSAWRRVEGGDWDQHLAVIKMVVRVFERVLPEEFLAQVTGSYVHARQPGSLF